MRSKAKKSSKKTSATSLRFHTVHTQMSPWSRTKDARGSSHRAKKLRERPANSSEVRRIETPRPKGKLVLQKSLTRKKIVVPLRGKKVLKRELKKILKKKIPALRMCKELPLTIKNLDANLLVGVLHKPLRGSRTLIIIMHGFLGTKNSVMCRQQAVEISKAGYAAYRFDFSGNGDSEGRFEDATPRKMLRDIMAIVEYFRKSYAKIILCGYSLAGTLSIIAASRLKVEGVISIAAPMNPDPDMMLTPRQKEQLVSVGFTTIPVQTLVGPVPYTITKQFIEEVMVLEPLQQAIDVYCPVLIIHGTSDILVPQSDSERLAALLPRKELYLIPGADHLYMNPKHLDAVIGKQVEWLKKIRD